MNNNKKKMEYNLEYIPIIKPRHASLSTISNVNSIKKNYVYDLHLKNVKISNFLH